MFLSTLWILGAIVFVRFHRLRFHSSSIFFLFVSRTQLTSGYILNVLMPINKKIWSLSFALVTAGWALVALTITYLLVDVLGRFARELCYVGENVLIA